MPKAKLRKMEPGFIPQKLLLKQEDGSTSNPMGPLFYVGPDQLQQTCPVYLDLEMPTDLGSRGFMTAWFNLREAKKIAAELKLPLEIF